MGVYDASRCFIENRVPKLEEVRNKIVMALYSYGGGGVVPAWGLDFSGAPADSFGSHTNTARLDGSPVTFHVQGYYDDSSKGNSSRADEAYAIQNNILGAAENSDRHNWYITGTNRANGLPSSWAFAHGGDGPWPLNVGYNQIALDQINRVLLTGRPDQQTVGVVSSDFPNDTGGYIDAIIARNPGLP
jgi:hypothetical protein